MISNLSQIHEGDYLRNQQDHYFRVIRVSAVSIRPSSSSSLYTILRRGAW